MYEKTIMKGRETMPEQQRKQIDYMVVCVNEFAKKKSIHPQMAFLYLDKYKGIDFLQEHFDIEHTLSLEDTVEDLALVCRNNGGELN